MELSLVLTMSRPSSGLSFTQPASLRFDVSKPDGSLQKLRDVSNPYALG
jgi:hypothetical protein